MCAYRCTLAWNIGRLSRKIVDSADAASTPCENDVGAGWETGVGGDRSVTLRYSRKILDSVEIASVSRETGAGVDSEAEMVVILRNINVYDRG